MTLNWTDISAQLLLIFLWTSQYETDSVLTQSAAESCDLHVDLLLTEYKTCLQLMFSAMYKFLFLCGWHLLYEGFMLLLSVSAFSGGSCPTLPSAVNQPLSPPDTAHDPEDSCFNEYKSLMILLLLTQLKVMVDRRWLQVATNNQTNKNYNKSLINKTRVKL